MGYVAAGACENPGTTGGAGRRGAVATHGKRRFRPGDILRPECRRRTSKSCAARSCRPATARSGGAGLDAPLVQPHGLVRELGLLAAAHEQAPGPVARAGVGRPVRQPLPEQLERAVELVVAALRGAGALHELRLDAAPLQVARDALGPPQLERALVLGELLGVALVVEEAALGELLDGRIDCARLVTPALQEGLQLGHGASARGECLVRKVDGPGVIGVPWVVVIHDDGLLASAARWFSGSSCQQSKDAGPKALSGKPRGEGAGVR